MHRIKSGKTLISVASALLINVFDCGLPVVASQQFTAPVQGRPEKTQPSGWSTPYYAQAGAPTPQPIVAPPPAKKLVGRRQTASPRGCSRKGKYLTALMPETNLGLTFSLYPTFFFYIPPTSAQTAEFVLLDEETEDTVYTTTFNISGLPGTVSVSLPSDKTLPKLKIGKNYHWYFSVICDPQERSGDAYVDGWVQRVTPNSTLISELKTASPLERLAIYTNADIWFERLTTLAELRRLNPNDPNLAAQWANLLRSVGLDKIAQEPLVQP